MQVSKTISLLRNIMVLSIVLIFIYSCSGKIEFDQFKSIEEKGWHKDSIINFTFNSMDSISKKNIYINLRNNKDYEFSNLFLIVSVKFPNNYQIVDTLEYEMTTPEGRFLGTGISDIKENNLEYKTHVNFPISGDYNIHIQHAMRKTRKIEGIKFLHGVTDVGLQIEKAN